MLYPDLRTTIARYRIAFSGYASDPGLPDVFEALGTNNFARIGLGINGVHSTASLEEWESFISTNFAAEELTLFRGRALPRIRDAVRLFLEGKLNPRPAFRVRWVRGSHYECGERIGEGKFGAVFAARDTRTGTPVVLKMLKRARDMERKIAAEVAMLIAVRGAANVVRLLETAVVEDDEYRDEAMVFELVESVSHKVLFPMLTPALMRVYVYKLLQALEAVHALGVVHLDVKPSNILFNPRTLDFRLIDWGLAIYHIDGVPNHGPLGTRCFKAPELCLRYDLYGPPVDLWAVGCTLGSMLLIGDDGVQPFFKARGSWSQQLLAIVRIVGSDALFLAMDRLGLGLHLRPEEAAALRGWRRVEWREMIRPTNEHLACQDGFELLTRLLDCDCESRVTAKDALAFPFFDSVR